MKAYRHSTWTRREALSRFSAAVGAGMLGLGVQPAIAEPPPETRTIRIDDTPVLCFAPLLVAEAFLRAEGFTDVRKPRYKSMALRTEALREGGIDILAGLVTDHIAGIDAGAPMVVLSGLHPGCIQTFANDRLTNLSDLAGKRVAITAPGDHMHKFLSSVAANIGLNPAREIEWTVEPNFRNWPQLLANGQVDVVAAFPPQTFQLQEQNIGHIILDTTIDAPWRHYFCCMITARREFVDQYPVATKRALRALLNSIEFCAQEPESAARLLVQRGITSNYEYALKTLRQVPYGAWPTYDPEDTLRFYTLRLREAGLVAATPKELIARGANFRFLDELRQELKG